MSKVGKKGVRGNVAGHSNAARARHSAAFETHRGTVTAGCGAMSVTSTGGCGAIYSAPVCADPACSAARKGAVTEVWRQ